MIGENIRKRRIELGMTQEDLAKKVGYRSKTTINKIEKGVNDIPLQKVIVIAKALDIHPVQLVGWEKNSR